MFNRNKGIRGILPPVRLPKEVEEDAREEAAAKEYVRERVGTISEYQPIDASIFRISSSLDKLQAAPKQVKDKDGFTPAQNTQLHKYLTRPSTGGAASAAKRKKTAYEVGMEEAHAGGFINRKKVNDNGAKYIPWYERNTEANDGVKKFNHHDRSTYPHAQKDKLMKAEIADKIKRGKLPTKDGVQTLQYVTDTIKNYDGKPETHKPRWMVNYQNGELEDVNDPNWMDNQIKQGLVPDSLVKQHQAENKPKIQKTNFGYVKTIPEKKSTVQQLEALRNFGQNPLVKNEQRKKDYLLKRWGIQDGPHNPKTAKKV